MSTQKVSGSQDPLGVCQDYLPNIKNVWKYNVEKEFARLSKAIEDGYTWIAMDTEFPGFYFNTQVDNQTSEMAYRILKMNVDNLKLIQVGFSLSNEKGQKPKDIHTWQFNLNFNVNFDKSHPESISILKDAGISFEELIEHGIDPMVFGDLLMSSGLMVNSDVFWIAFHGAYDFSYVLKVLVNDALPPNSENFLQYLKHLFPNIYDIKTIINDIDEWKNFSLSKLANDLSVKRTGHTHQAGSDALLTLEVYFMIINTTYPEGIPAKYFNKVFGISNDGSFAFPSFQPTELILPNIFHVPPYFQSPMYMQDQMMMQGSYYYPQQQLPEMMVGIRPNIPMMHPQNIYPRP